MPTHEVTNQAPPLVDYNAAAIDRPLQDVLRRSGTAEISRGLDDLGRRVGDPQVQRWAIEANAVTPTLRTHDRYGHRIDEVDFHPSWHRLMKVAVAEGLHGAPWSVAGGHPHLRRAAGFYVWGQAEAGHGCPISMTYAMVPALRQSPELAHRYQPGLTSVVYEPGLHDPALKGGLIAGMAMTEKQGGSDVRSNTTAAVRRSDETYGLTGHKWFCSAPMSDVFLVLAQIEGEGLSCFLVPRVLPGGERNVFLLQRLKDKLGNRSNASAEVEFDETTGWLVGEPGRGIHTIMSMITITRLDCIIGAAAGQRAALVQAIHHARHRSAFGARLIDQPLMRSVLADLALEGEAATALTFRLAAAVDGDESSLLRIALPAAKFWVCKRSPVVVGEALECLGGNGYIEESGLPRLFRESPLNSIWEGSGNVMALDVLRGLGDQEARHALEFELDLARGADRNYDRALSQLKINLSAADPAGARRITTAIAVLLQAALLIREAPAAVAEAFCQSRLGGGWGPVFGSLPEGVDLKLILERAFAD